MDRDYFRAIEEAFVELRGAPLLLSPGDWQIARSWFERGVPSEFVVAELRRVFERRRESGETGRVHRLKYLASAIDEAWKEREDFLATGARQPQRDDSSDHKRALQDLAEALPSDLVDRARWRERISGLTESLDDSEKVEERLRELETAVLRESRDALASEERREIQSGVDAALEAVRDRLSEQELRAVSQRIERRLLREKLGLPPFSLFSGHRHRGD